MCKKCLHPKSFLPKPIPMTNKEVMQLLANEKHEKAKKRLEGIKIGRLKVIKFDYWRYTDKRRYAYYKVKCKCGNVKSVKLDSLSVIKSCGCLQKEMQRLPGKQKNCLVTMDEAKTIRKLKKSGMYLQKEIAKMFNIPDTTVSLIILNKSYRETTASDTPKQ